MTDLIVRENNLPATMEDLSKFVLVGRDKLQAVRAEISAMKNLNLAKEVREQKLAEGQEIGKLVLLAEARLGELFNQIPKATKGTGSNQYQEKTAEIPAAGKFSNAQSVEIVDETPAIEPTVEEPPADCDDAPPPQSKLKPKLEIAAEMGFNKNQVAQFQKLADNPEAVQKAIAEADENEEIVTRSKALENIKETKEDKKPHIFFNSGNNEWYTPAEFIEAARRTMGTIDLDPASSEIANETVKATKFFTAEDDGLSKIWEGNIWLNPPYSSGLIEKFTGKLLASDYKAAIVLVNNATDTEWFSRLAEIADAVVFPKGRVKFLRPDGTPGAPLQGQAILYFGGDVEAFKNNFEKYGRCWQ